jgi:hypothetical protein
MRNSTTVRFAAAAVLWIVAGLLVLDHALIAAAACAVPLSFLVPREFPDLSDPAMRRWLLGVGVALIILLAVLGIVYFHPIVSAGTIGRIIFHPAFVLAVWLLGLWSLFRRWRRQRCA